MPPSTTPGPTPALTTDLFRIHTIEACAWHALPAPHGPLVAWLEPFGAGAYGLATKYWTAAERNTINAPLTGLLLAINQNYLLEAYTLGAANGFEVTKHTFIGIGTPVTLIVCGAAYGISGDWDRVLAVLAVVTPCPLILATPVAVLTDALAVLGYDFGCALLERAAYDDRLLFEYWGHEAALIRIDLQPNLRWRMARARAGTGVWSGLNRFATRADRHLAQYLSVVWRFAPTWEAGVRHDLLRVTKTELGKEARRYNFNTYADARSIFRYDMHTLPSEISETIGTSTLFAAWNAAIYVAQVEDHRVAEAAQDGRGELRGAEEDRPRHAAHEARRAARACSRGSPATRRSAPTWSCGRSPTATGASTSVPTCPPAAPRRPGQRIPARPWRGGRPAVARLRPLRSLARRAADERGTRGGALGDRPAVPSAPPTPATPTAQVNAPARPLGLPGMGADLPPAPAEDPARVFDLGYAGGLVIDPGTVTALASRAYLGEPVDVTAAVKQAAATAA